MHTDVAVIGLGVMGSMALWRLAERGIRVTGFEQFEPGHDRGSSHGESRIIRTAYFEDPRYVPLVRRAFALWRELERSSDAALLTMTGALMIGRPDHEVVAGTLASVREHDLKHELLDANRMRMRYPPHILAPDEVAVHERAAGFVRAEPAIRGAIRRAEHLGATVLRRTPVERVEVEAGGVRIHAGGTAYRTRHAIVSVGPWLGEFFADLRLPVRVERQVLTWCPIRRPEPFAPERFPVFMHDTDAGYVGYGFPTLDGRTIKLGIHHDGELTDPNTIDRQARPGDLDKVQLYVREHLRDVEPRAVRSQVCMYTNTPDEHFLVGSPAGAPAITMLGGFSGHGFKFGPIIGEAAADLALKGGTDLPIDLFAPDRDQTTTTVRPPGRGAIYPS